MSITVIYNYNTIPEKSNPKIYFFIIIFDTHLRIDLGNYHPIRNAGPAKPLHHSRSILAGASHGPQSLKPLTRYPPRRLDITHHSFHGDDYHQAGRFPRK